MSNDNQPAKTEDQKTIDAIKLVSQKERTPEEAQQFLIDAGIEPAISKEEVLKMHIERNTGYSFDNIMETKGTVNTIATCGLDAMQEFSDLQTAAILEENERLKAENAELREGLKWNDVNELLPKSGTSVLSFPNYKLVSFGYDSEGVGQEGFWDWEGDDISGYHEASVKPHPTHWMPLPEPPESYLLEHNINPS